MIPPRAKPLPDPMAAKELKIPMAFARSLGSVKVWVTIENADGIINAAPIP
ncbi:hypothetical protein D3C85_1183260 [compost metagenome]